MLAISASMVATFMEDTANVARSETSENVIALSLVSARDRLGERKVGFNDTSLFPGEVNEETANGIIPKRKQVFLLIMILDNQAFDY